MTATISLDDVRRWDEVDTFSSHKDAFSLPADTIYLDGNSLGPLQHRVKDHLGHVIAEQWGEGLIRSWNTHSWVDLPSRVAVKIEGLIGAAPQTVSVGDTTSINLFKALSAALRMRPGRKVILSEKRNFPTDLHIAQGLADLLNDGYELRTIDIADLDTALGDDIAVVLLTEVNYRTGAKLDMIDVTEKVHAHGALMIWDLCHSAGAFKTEVEAAKADFAVGCGYKFLNGGPGAPAYIYVAPQHLPDFKNPMTGWFGHEAPFKFTDEFVPAASADKMQVGTPGVLATSALDVALDIYADVDMEALRAKADRLFDIFCGIVTSNCPELDMITPLEPSARGSQICFAFENSYALVQALKSKNVIGDFRMPNVARFGMSPLYLSHEDVWNAAQTTVEVMQSGLWKHEEFQTVTKVV